MQQAFGLAVLQNQFVTYRGGKISLSASLSRRVGIDLVGADPERFSPGYVHLKNCGSGSWKRTHQEVEKMILK
jgi:hypothetical protein